MVEFLLAMVVLNAVLTALYHATGSTLFSVAINAVGGFTVLASLAACFLFGGLTRWELMGSFALAMVLAINILLNLAETNFTVVIKILTPFVVYYAARTATGWPRGFWLAIAILTLLPFAFALTTTSKVINNWAVWSYFVNLNTASIYFASLILAVTVRTGRNLAWLQIAAAVITVKIGILLATVMAVAAWTFLRPSVRNALLLVTALVIGIVAYSMGFLNRPLEVLAPLVRDINAFGFTGLANVQFGALVERNQSTDLSGYFRIIHWANITRLWLEGGPSVWLFGYGAGQSQHLTHLRLVPHNDYLRLLAETGIFMLGIFTAFIAHALVRLKEVGAKIIFTVLVIYFGTDNLIDNFAAMTMFFCFAGLAGR